MRLGLPNKTLRTLACVLMALAPSTAAIATDVPDGPASTASMGCLHWSDSIVCTAPWFDASTTGNAYANRDSGRIRADVYWTDPDSFSLAGVTSPFYIESDGWYMLTFRAAVDWAWKDNDKAHIGLYGELCQSSFAHCGYVALPTPDDEDVSVSGYAYLYAGHGHMAGIVAAAWNEGFASYYGYYSASATIAAYGVEVTIETYTGSTVGAFYHEEQEKLEALDDAWDLDQFDLS